MFSTEIGNYVILKTERPSIFSSEGAMDKYLGGIFEINSGGSWFSSDFRLKFVIPNQCHEDRFNYISRWVFNSDSCDPIKTRYLQLFLNTLST